MNVYIVHHLYHANNYQWEQEINEIKELNPDRILCLCLEEYDFRFIFKHFFNNIQPWLEENNKTVTVLVPNPNNLQITPNIVTESTSGIYIFFVDLLYKGISAPDTLNTHLKADKVFTSYNNNPKYERALLVDELVKRSLLQHGIVTFIYPERVSFSMKSEPFLGWKYHDGSRLLDEQDFELNSKPEFNAGSIPASFTRGFIDLVSESHVEPEEFFLTEKTIKSIAQLKPFIALCSAGYHTDYLANMYGLELYDELFDYSFDTMPNVKDRINGLVDNIERIVQIYNNDYRDQMHETLLPKMIRNRQRMIDFGLNKDKMVPTSLKFLTDGTDYTMHGHVKKLTEYTLQYYRKMGWMK